jgi:hypothetical protein
MYNQEIESVAAMLPYILRPALAPGLSFLAHITLTNIETSRPVCDP